MVKPVLGERVLLVPQVWAILTNPHLPDGNAIGKDPEIIHAVGARHGDHRDDDVARPRWETFTSTLVQTGYGVMVVREGVLLEGPAKWDSGD
jgi:hypothetical protein